MNAAWAAASAIAMIGGVMMVGHGLRRRPAPVSHRRNPARQSWARRLHARTMRLLIVGAVAGVMGYAATGWAVAVLMIPLAFVGLPWLLGTPANRDIEVLSALDRWVHTLTATLPTGQSVADAIRISVRSAPPAIAAELAEAVAGLRDRLPVRDALLRMADRLDSPDSDAVLAALILAADRGGLGASATLTALSESIQQRLAAAREIEAERAKPRVVVRQVTIITVVALTLTITFSGGFFAPYRSWLGQLILLVLCLAYAGSLVMLRVMVTPARRPRILSRSA